MKNIKNITYIIVVLSILALSGCDNTVKENVTEEHHEEANRVELTSSQYKNAGIVLGRVEMKNINSTLQVNGLLDVPPQNLVSVSALMGGFVKTTELLQGMQVRKGEIIATIQNPDFIQIQQDYLDNKSKLIFAEQEYKRQEELAKENVASQKILQQITSEYNSLKAIHSGLLEKLAMLGIDSTTIEKGIIKSTVSIVSPINGFVTSVNINIGKYVNSQDVICEIVDTDHLHVELTVFEKDLTKIKVGQKVRFVLVNEGTKERTATVYLINRKIADDRTVRVHAHLDKEDRNLIPSTYLKAYIEVTNNQTTAVPDEAIVSSGGKFYIFIKDDGHGHEHLEEKQKEGEEKHEEEYAFTSVEIRKGVSQNGYTEIILPDNFELDHAEVVIKGAYDLLAKMNNSEEEGHAH
jgi:membrane fusion protein, heavy metal efflux system